MIKLKDSLNKVTDLNLLAVDMLASIGYDQPSKYQVRLMEKVIVAGRLANSTQYDATNILKPNSQQLH